MWTGERRNEEFSFYSVEPDGSERERIEQVTGGSLSLSAFSDLKQTASLDFYGKAPTAKRVRIYYDFDSYDKHERAMLATLYTSVPEISHDGTVDSGKIACWSSLGILSKKIYGLPFTVKKGENAVKKAVDLIRLCNVACIAEESPYVLAADHTFKPEDNYLTIVNWLLDVAGFTSAKCNARGEIVLSTYVPPEKRSSVWDFNEGDASVTYPEISEDSGLDDVPNVFKAMYQTDTQTYYAEARNNDAMSPTSIASVGYESTAFETVDEVAGNIVDSLKAIAKKRLLDSMTVIQKAKFACNYVPVLPDNSVTISAYGLGLNGTITSMQIDLGVAAKTSVEIRRFIKSGMNITVIGSTI